ncbi:MAG: amidohydrolase family protein [Acidimicrobiales bacterium]|nr:amidohydrolase family protein [Acidimicrobiales bacterium]
MTIEGVTIVDGTGAPARVGDVAIDSGRIVAVTEPGAAAAVAGTSSKVIDGTGLVVAPGFVDLHTHYDAQLMWDPTASPSPLHGVTTVFGGNCGFGLAPAGDEHADYLARLMARVEGIPLAAIEAGVSWDWRSFAEWIARIERQGIGVNAGFLAGHSAVRRQVMGADAVGAEATPGQIEAMVAELRSMLASGAMGFSTSRSHTHNDGDGQPVPSRAASDAEVLALCKAVGEFPGTQLEAIVPGCINGFSHAEMQLLASMSTAAQRPLNWNVLGVAGGEGHLRQLEASEVALRHGGRVVALTLPQSMRIRLSFLSGMVLDAFPGWAEFFGLSVADRIAALRDPAVRRRLDDGAQSPEAGLIGLLANWKRLRIVETFAPQCGGFEGRTVGEIAQERGVDPFDALCDIVVADELRTGIAPEMPPESPEIWAQRREVWADPRVIIGGSDAGAHLDMMCGATYSTFLVGPAVRDLGLLPLEEAVRLLTDVPARFYGLRGRGRIEPGWVADLVVFDPEVVGPGHERTHDDLPGGASRLYATAVGVNHVLVNGIETVCDGQFTGATPGIVLRSGRDTETVSVRTAVPLPRTHEEA